MDDSHRVDAQIDEAGEQLILGLRSCQSLIKNYRAMLAPQATPEQDKDVDCDRKREQVSQSSDLPDGLETPDGRLREGANALP